MTEIMRLNTAISRALMRRPDEPNSGLPYGFTEVGLIPCRRSSARTKLGFLAVYSPLIFVPRLSIPTQLKGCS